MGWVPGILRGSSTSAYYIYIVSKYFFRSNSYISGEIRTSVCIGYQALFVPLWGSISVETSEHKDLIIFEVSYLDPVDKNRKS